MSAPLPSHLESLHALLSAGAMTVADATKAVGRLVAKERAAKRRALESPGESDDDAVVEFDRSSVASSGIGRLSLVNRPVPAAASSSSTQKVVTVNLSAAAQADIEANMRHFEESHCIMRYTRLFTDHVMTTVKRPAVHPFSTASKALWETKVGKPQPPKGYESQFKHLRGNERWNAIVQHEAHRRWLRGAYRAMLVTDKTREAACPLHQFEVQNFDVANPRGMAEYAVVCTECGYNDAAESERVTQLKFRELDAANPSAWR